MGVGSKSLITDPYDSNEIARVIAGRLLVTTQAGGGGGITADVNIEAVGGVLIGTTVPVSGTVSVTEPVSVDDNGGSLTVDGTVAVSSVAGVVTVTGTVAATQSGAWTVTVVEPVSVDDNGGSLTVDGTVAVSSVAGTVTIVDGGGSITVDGAVTVSGTVSVTEPVSVDDNGGSLTVDGTVIVQTTDVEFDSAVGVQLFTPGMRVDANPIGAFTDNDLVIPRLTANGTQWVSIFGTAGLISVSIDASTTAVITGIASTAFAVDSVAGVDVFPAGAVRDDALTTLTPVDGDYVNLRTDSTGALWVRERGDIVNVLVLSGSTDGAPIRITATTFGTAITLHTASATAGVRDRISLWGSNIGGSGVITLTLATTDGGANSETRFVIMGEQTVYLGVYTIEDSEVLIAYASTANAVRVFGEVFRHTA